MNVPKYDLRIVRLIVKYCDIIYLSRQRFGDSFSVFQTDEDYKNACCMYVFQIGELSTRLSDEFRDRYAVIPWREIRGIKNVFVHKYKDIDKNRLWDTIVNDIPVLKKFCEECLQEEKK